MKNYDWSDKNILIVEDNKTNMVLLEHMLKTTDVNLFLGKNSKEFYLHINNKNISFDLILMDISLNENITGIDLIEYLNDNKFNIPVILQTAYDVEDLDYPNYDNIIRKPINRIKLLEMIDKIFTKN